MEESDERGTQRRETGYDSLPRITFEDEITRGWRSSPGVRRGRGLAYGRGDVESPGQPLHRVTPGSVGQPGVTPGLAGLALGTPDAAGHTGSAVRTGRSAASPGGRGAPSELSDQVAPGHLPARQSLLGDLRSGQGRTSPVDSDSEEDTWRYVTQRREKRPRKPRGRSSVACGPDGEEAASYTWEVSAKGGPTVGHTRDEAHGENGRHLGSLGEAQQTGSRPGPMDWQLTGSRPGPMAWQPAAGAQQTEPIPGTMTWQPAASAQQAEPIPGISIPGISIRPWQPAASAQQTEPIQGPIAWQPAASAQQTGPRPGPMDRQLTGSIPGPMAWQPAVSAQQTGPRPGPMD